MLAFKMKARTWSAAAVLATLVLVPFVVLSGCGRKAEDDTKTTTAPVAPALWKISDEDSTIWLFGTFHLLPEDTDWRRPAIDEAFTQADTLILEANVDGTDQDALYYLLATYAVAAPETSLLSRMEPEQVAAFQALSNELGVDPDSLTGFQPWYAATVLSVQFAKNNGFNAEKGVEAALAADAKASGKAVAYFETVEQQIRFFSEMPEAAQIGMLTSTVEDLRTAAATLDDMKQAWLSADTDKIAALINGSLAEVPDVYETLMVNRNTAWADEIAGLLAGSGSAFVAVGAGHLVGDRNLIEQLDDKGITADRI